MPTGFTLPSLAPKLQDMSAQLRSRGKIDRLFAKAVERRIHGRPGLYMQSRFPALDHENGKTCAPYSVFQGFSDLFENFDGWMAKTIGARVHGSLFAPERVEFAGAAREFNGGLS